MSNDPGQRSPVRGGPNHPATDRARLRADTEPSRGATVAPAVDNAFWAVPNYIPFAIAASFATMPLISELTLLDVVRHYAIGAGVMAGGFLLFMISRGALGAGVIKLAAALSVWIGGGESLAMFLAACALLPVPLAYLAVKRGGQAFSGHPSGRSVPYWPIMALVFAAVAPGVEAAQALRPILPL